ncbi:uncharacterized protein YndB with AHSA1/START domain [Bradyrhizobium sp. USDA 4486]
MGALGIELVHEGIEALLLLQAVEARRPGGLLLEGEMHALVPAILLRMTWLDALDGDTEAEPPYRELGKIEQGVGTGKRHAIVGPNGKRQAALAEQALEGGHGRLLARGVERLAQQQEARGMIADG